MAILSSPFSLEEECEAPLCTVALTAKNQELQSDTKRVTSMFDKLQNYINILALPSKLTSSEVHTICHKLMVVHRAELLETSPKFLSNDYKDLYYFFFACFYSVK